MRARNKQPINDNNSPSNMRCIMKRSGVADIAPKDPDYNHTLGEADITSFRSMSSYLAILETPPNL